MEKVAEAVLTSGYRAFRFLDLEFDLEEEVLRRNGERIAVPRRTLQVLRLLIERRGEIVTKEEFFERVWQGSFVEENNLSVAIATLRKVLGDNARPPTLIETFPKKGYRFSADVTAIPKVQPSGIEVHEETIDPVYSSDKVPITRRRPVLATLGAIVLVSLITIAGFTARDSNNGGPRSSPEAVRSLAVLPFEGDSADNAYLADGLTEDLIRDLARLPDVKVIDYRSVEKYRDPSIDRNVIAGELGVKAIVFGRVVRHDDNVVVEVELSEPGANTPVWTQRLRRQMVELQDLRQELIRSVLGQIHVATGDIEKAGLTSQRNEDPIAYDLYLKGRYYWNKRDEAALLKAADLFKAAIDRDPTYSRAYVGLADSYTLGAFADIHLSDEAKNALVRANIQKAIDLDDKNAEAYAARGISKCYYEWDFSGAESDYVRAIELNPNYATAHHWYAEFLSMRGRFSESEAEYQRALSIDPLSTAIRADMAYSYYYARDYDKAIEQLMQVKAIDPKYARASEFLGFVYQEQGRFEEAADSFETVARLQFQTGSINKELLNARLSHFAQMRNAARVSGAAGYWKACLNSELRPRLAPFTIAVAYSRVGDMENALEYLNKAYDQRYSGMVWLKVTPEADALRAEQSFGEILKRVGI